MAGIIEEYGGELNFGEIMEEYRLAVKAGKKYYNDKIRHGGYPYPLILDDMVEKSSIFGTQDIGVVDIPIEFIVGMKFDDRAPAFAGNFMPILPEGSEFANKWRALYRANLRDEGIVDPIKCYEYLGKFYVEEGNKRVSVLRHLGAVSIRASVTRIIPNYSEENAIAVYYEFMHFYSLTKLYTIDFNYMGYYNALLVSLGMKPEHEWTEDERRTFNNGFAIFQHAYRPLREQYPDITDAEALLAWLHVFDFVWLKDTPITKLTEQIKTIIPDVQAERNANLNVLSTAPREESRNIRNRLRDAMHSMLNAALIYGASLNNDWTKNHDNGRKYIEALYNKKVKMSVYNAINGDYYEQMVKAVEDGADVLFATMPNMIEAARRIAVEYKHIKVHVCALALPYAGVRMYYIRSYECRFIAGAIAGAMTNGDIITYNAHYPICGATADINAFALGVAMTNCHAKVALHWTCVPGDEPVDGFNYKDYFIQRWNWGYFYEKIIKSILDGSWHDYREGESISYWWGLSARVTDMILSRDVPSGIAFMAENIKQSIINQSLDPFRMRIVDQDGMVRNDGKQSIPADELMKMDWLCENVIGAIPEIDDVIPEAREMVSLLGIHRDNLLPKKEVQL